MSDPLPVLTAVGGPHEALLVQGLERVPEVQVVRRCADVAELLASASTGLGDAAVVSADLRHLDGDALTRLAEVGCAVVVVVDPGEQSARTRLDRLGVAEVLDADAPAVQVAAALLREHARLARVALQPTSADARGGSRHGADLDGATSQTAAPQPDRSPRTSSGLADPGAALAPVRVSEPDAPDGDLPAAPGRVVAVWGPIGAPGRTSVAIGLAAELAALGESALILDADTYGASVAQTLGLLDEAPGLASAARAADQGTLDLVRLAGLAPAVGDRLRVLTGIARAHRWPELRPGALASVLELSRSLAAWSVVDTGFALEQDEELVYDTVAPRRNGATLAALEVADVVVAVGSADPIGLQRLVRGLQDLAEVVPTPPVVVVNRVRPGAVGPNPSRRVRDALQRYAGVTDPVLVPADDSAHDGALLAGRTLAEHAPSSPARLALVELAERLVDQREGRPAGRRATASRRARRRVSPARS